MEIDTVASTLSPRYRCMERRVSGCSVSLFLQKLLKTVAPAAMSRSWHHHHHHQHHDIAPASKSYGRIDRVSTPFDSFECNWGEIVEYRLSSVATGRGIFGHPTLLLESQVICHTVVQIVNLCRTHVVPDRLCIAADVQKSQPLQNARRARLDLPQSR
jgi:hypothetical protein